MKPLFTLLLSSFSFPSSARARAISEYEIRAVPEHEVLAPISDEGWPGREHRQGGKGWALQQNEHFVWGSKTGSGSFANMTLETGDDELVISMERFAGELRKVDCSSDMMMEFVSESTYRAAIAEWDWVNLHEKHTFIIVANYEGCGAGESRDPWVVNNAHYDDPHQTVYLKAMKKTWQEIAHTYSLDFGRHSPATSIKRGIVDVDKSKTFSIPLATAIPQQFMKPKTIDGITVGIDCTDCATKGSIEITGRVTSSKKSGLTVFNIQAAPKGVSADISLTLSASGTLKTAWDQQFNIISVSMPGYSIPGVLDIGPALRFDGGLTLSNITGKVGVTSGMTATIPDTSKAMLDFVGKKTHITGWIPTIKGKPVSFSASVSAEFDVYLQLALAVGLKCLGNGFSVDLALKLPEVAIKGEATYDTAKPPCPNTTKKGGVSIGASMGAGLSFQAYSQLAGKKNYIINKSIFDKPDLFASPKLCLPFDAPGIAAETAKKPSRRYAIEQ